MEEAKQLSINFVTWNSAAYLPGCFASLDDQEWNEFSIAVVDNASNDGSVKWLQDNRPDVTALRNFRNQGSSRAKNQAIALAFSRWQEEQLGSRYVMLASPEVEFAPSCIGRLIAEMERDHSLAACGPKMLRVQFRAGGEEDHRDTERSTTIVSTGLFLTKSRAAIERGVGEDDKGQYDTATDVFGFSGGCILLRASALSALKLSGEWFDEDFGDGFEDVDLAWRLRRLGLRARLVPEAVAWRHVSSGVPRSARNRIWAGWKNDELGNRFAQLPWVVAGALHPSSIAGWFAALGGWGKMAKKRAELTKRAKVSGIEMRTWYV